MTTDEPPCCGKCVFAGEAAEGPLVCRRYPPVNITTTLTTWRQPRVFTNDWCGEFQRRNP